VWSSGICFALCAFVAASIVQEFVRGAKVRKDATGTDLLTATIGLVMRERRRYGGYIVHLGIVLMFLGFAGEGFKTDKQVLLKTGQEATIRHYTVRNNGVQVTDDGQKQMVTGHIAVSEDGRSRGTMYPARWFYRKHEEQPTTEVAIRRTIAEDLYLVMPAYDLQDQSVSLQIVVNPLVNWIWAGFGILFLGTGIALLPERSFAFEVGKAQSEASTN
jgi:cytochrome c-type biogenesis protein CcmF